VRYIVCVNVVSGDLSAGVDVAREVPWLAPVPAPGSFKLVKFLNGAVVTKPWATLFASHRTPPSLRRG
jgi:hypothetical protein